MVLFEKNEGGGKIPLHLCILIISSENTIHGIKICSWLKVGMRAA